MATTLTLAAGRVPPHDLDAEMSILGSILLDPLSIAKVLQFLHPEDFYRENNGQIFRAALDLFAAGEPITTSRWRLSCRRWGCSTVSVGGLSWHRCRARGRQRRTSSTTAGSSRRRRTSGG